MFTPGFRFFAGLSAVGLIGTFMYALSSGGTDGKVDLGFIDRESFVGALSLGWKGGVGDPLGFFVLLFLTGTAAFVGTTVVAFRDADVESVAELDNASTMPPAQRPTAPSLWPFASAIGIGTLIIGLVLDTFVFWAIGLVILAVTAIEWALTAWADRSTASAATNAVLRDRVLASFEIPLLAVAGAGIIALAVSRILLWWHGTGAVVAASVLAALIFALAIAASMKPELGRRTFGAIGGVLLLVVLVLGVIAQARLGEEASGEGEESAVESTVINE